MQNEIGCFSPRSRNREILHRLRAGNESAGGELKGCFKPHQRKKMTAGKHHFKGNKTGRIDLSNIAEGGRIHKARTVMVNVEKEKSWAINGWKTGGQGKNLGL